MKRVLLTAVALLFGAAAFAQPSASVETLAQKYADRDGALVMRLDSTMVGLVKLRVAALPDSLRRSAALLDKVSGMTNIMLMTGLARTLDPAADTTAFVRLESDFRADVAALTAEPVRRRLFREREAGVEVAGYYSAAPSGEAELVHSSACWRSGEIHGGEIDGKPVFPVPPRPASDIRETPRDERATTIKVDHLVKTFPLIKGALLKRRVGSVYAVDDISFDVRAGETLSIVGESGSGKSTTLLEIMAMSHDTVGEIELDGKRLKTLSRAQRRAERRNIQMVFQDPMGALDPRFTVYDIIAEPLHTLGFPRDGIEARVNELMNLVGLDPAHIDRFPGAFSGGQRQRIGIARALATNPKVLALDEPVSALDVSIQAGVINLLAELQAKLELSYLLVAHDLSVVRHISDRVAVLYLGGIVEIGDVDAVFDESRHPYTQALLSAIPIPDPTVERTRSRVVLKGDLPSPTDNEPGCRFASRCPLFQTLPEQDRARCLHETPALHGGEGADHLVACHFR